ncbi:MAG: polysulfide reductase NrfD [bacterium]|nr:polysulfide reductase NrfD [bacterium]
MNEITVTTNKLTTAGGGIHVWGWEVPVYLFLGGLTAGILVLLAWMILKNKNKDYSAVTNRLALFAPIMISLGMGALFLDLEHKLYVWRFYTTFRFTSPMSWGSWILLLVYPLSILLILATFRQGYPKLFTWIENRFKSIKFLAKHQEKFHILFDWPRKHIRVIAGLTIPVAVILGIYTGILLSAFNARPFWNSAILGPLFLVSGVSTAAAFVVLLSKDHQEKTLFAKIDLGLIGVEISLLVLFIIGMLSSSGQHKEAIQLILGGEFTAFFWVFIMGLGLLLPAFLEIMELRGKELPAAIAAMLVLVGGLLLRFLMVEAGQLSTWIKY